MKKATTLIGLTFLDSQHSQLFKESTGDDIIILEDISKVPFFDYPAKTDKAIASICLKGYVECSINLKPCMHAANDFFIVLPGQIIQYLYKSDDFEGLFIITSKRFIDNFELKAIESVPVFLYLKENPVMHLNPEELTILLDFQSMLKKVIQMTHNPQRLEIIRLLSQAFFQMIYSFQQSQQKDRNNKPKREALFEAFYNLILRHYKDSREVGFYAGKLCLTPKYLSVVIKELTGKSAPDWINDHIILEAKALLKSTNMTIQQISDELNFPSQSFFGKYFKRHTGISPSEYKRK